MIAVLSIWMLGCGSLATCVIEPCTILSMLLGLIIFTGKTCAFPLLIWYVYPAAGVIPVGLIVAMAAIGLSVLWNKA